MSLVIIGTGGKVEYDHRGVAAGEMCDRLRRDNCLHGMGAQDRRCRTNMVWWNTGAQNGMKKVQEMVRSEGNGLDHEDWARSTLPDTLFGKVLSLDESPVNIGDALSGERVDNDEVQENTIPVNKAPSDEHSKVDVPPTTNTKVAGSSTVIETAVAKKQHNLLNKMRLMDTRQEYDETVRGFVTRLHGLANISDPSKGCTKVDGTQDLSPGQVNTVLKQSRCWRCVKEGNSGRARDYNIRKNSCDAFNSTCEKCNLVERFATMCNSGDKKPKNRPARKKVRGEVMSWHHYCLQLKTMRQGRAATPPPTGVYKPRHNQPVSRRGHSGKPADKP